MLEIFAILLTLVMVYFLGYQTAKHRKMCPECGSKLELMQVSVKGKDFYWCRKCRRRLV